ncbi:MAG TPA: amylo-alpha-1,6-glucosidase [Phycisphaerae bacterium]|nr:amylo-alpha-1,6-glucosidase [Phycisphaerae bacterium]HRR83511.1 amylo-alpha-1,6-glucosidase [Phycisphaerae bacterium]
MIVRESESVVLSSRAFRIRLSTRPGTRRLVEEFCASINRDGRHDIRISLLPWTGFAGVTSHTREFFITTEGPQSPTVDVLRDDDQVCQVRYGPLFAASWEIYWTLGLANDDLRWDVSVHVGRKTLPDDEINLLAFDVPEDEEIADAWFDTGYILPPKHWFAVPEPEVTYRGNEGGRGVLDRRVRLKFAGDGHEIMYLNFAGGYGLLVACAGDNLFRIVPRATCRPAGPRDPRRLPPARFVFKSHERFCIGTPRWSENQVVEPQTRFQCSVVIQAHRPKNVETMHLETPDRTVGKQTTRFHRTHAHGSIAHRAGFAGGWHNVGHPRAHGVSFEYYLHGKAHFFGLHPAIDEVMARALDAVYQRETRSDGLVWGYGFDGRGAFHENNASMLIFLADYARRTGDLCRLKYGERWAEYILANCTDRPFLYLTPTSTGIPGPGNGARVCNWWDVVSCGGYDAFINVLTYPALRDLAEMERAAGNVKLADHYAAAARRLRQSFNELFWDERAGRYISWVDTQGGRHDYFFTSVNLIAAAESIADQPMRRRILDSIDRRVAELGYKGFSLPCNLVSIPPEHYNAGDWWLETYGYPHFYDLFGTYENGGIFPWVSAYYIAAMAEFDPDKAYDHYLAILNQYERDNLHGAGNGYFWDTETGLPTEGSKQEPYLANVAVTVWGFMSLFGLTFDFTKGIAIRPRLPRRLNGSVFSIRYHGSKVTFHYRGYGVKVTSLRIDGRDLPPDGFIPAERLREESIVEVEVSE